MIVLGLHISGAQSSAAIFKDNKITFAIAQERIDRIKHSNAFPMDAIKECLEFENLKSLDEVDKIAISWNPAINMKNINMSGFTSWRRYDPEWTYIVPNHLMQLSSEVEQEMSLSWNANKNKVYFVNHHMSHLAQAYYQSKFNDCAVMICDEYSELPSITFADITKGKIQIIKEINFPHSLGAYYAMITEFLGFRPNSDEWKVMGSAAYGKAVYLEKLRELMYWDKKNNELVLNLKYFNHYNLKQATYLSKFFIDFIGFSPNKDTKNIQQKYYDFAASAQKLYEEILFDILNSLQKLTKQKNVVLSGGSFMNSLANGKILKNTLFSDLFIPYSASDTGGSIGSALWVAHKYSHVKKQNEYSSAYLAKEFSNAYIKKVLNDYKIDYIESKDVAKQIAKEISDGKIVGWFQGRMEFGERALGNRSILANPRDKKIKEKLNSSIKYRESFRPFAPAILKDKVYEYFDIEKGLEVPYMQLVYPIKKDKRSLIPAVVHNDNTGRLQTVSKQQNKKFYKLINEFYKLTNIPIVINTSFNLNGEPIVYTPKDAIRTFYSSGLDILVLNDCIVRK